MCLLWSSFIAAFYCYYRQCFRSISRKCSNTCSPHTQPKSSMSDMARESKDDAASDLIKTASLKRPRKQRKSTKSPSLQPSSPKSKTAQGRQAQKRKLRSTDKASSPKSKTTKERQPKKRKLRNTERKQVKKRSKQEHNASVITVKLQSKEAREPSGLQTPLSTSSWDLYSEKMPDNIAEAVSERVELWLFQKDTPTDYERRCVRYGEDIASSFPSGGTPGYAQMLERIERDGKGDS